MSEMTLKHLACPVVIARLSAAEIRGDTLADAIRSELLAVYLQSSALHIILDLTAVTFLTSAGFRPFLSLHRQVRQRQGRLILCNLHPVVAETLAVTRLIASSGATQATFETFPDVPAAIASLYAS